MPEITTVLGLEKALGGEKYSRPLTNRNLDRIETEAIARRKAKNAQFNMIAARSGAPGGSGVNWGHLQVDLGRPGATTNVQNDFCVLANDGVAGQASEKGRVRITKAGIYNIHANYTCTGNPGALNFAAIVDKVEGGSDKISMSRDGTYGDWEAHVVETGKWLNVGDHISGYQANSSAVAWAIGLRITYVGEV